MSNYDFSFTDNDSQREIDVEERIFPNGRRMQALNRESVQYEDENGTLKFGVRRTANADCGCSSRLIDMYFCFRCQKIVCYRHTAITPCSVCLQPSFCHQCLIALDMGDGKPVPICLNCLEQLKHSFVWRVFSKIWKFIFHGKINENALAKRNTTDSPKF